MKTEVIDQIVLRKNLSLMSPMLVEEDSLIDKEEQLRQELVKCGLIEPETVFDIDEKSEGSSPRASSLKLPERGEKREMGKRVRFAEQQISFYF